MKLFIKTFLSSKLKKHFNLTRALSCLEAYLHMLLICRLQLTWSSMCIPSYLTDEAISATWFPIKNCLGLLVWLLFWIIMISVCYGWQSFCFQNIMEILWKHHGNNSKLKWKWSFPVNNSPLSRIMLIINIFKNSS